MSGVIDLTRLYTGQSSDNSESFDSDAEREEAMVPFDGNKHAHRGFILANAGRRGLQILDDSRYGGLFDAMMELGPRGIGWFTTPDGRDVASVMRLPDDKYRLVVELAHNDLPHAMAIALEFMPQTTQPAYLTSKDELAVCMHVTDLALLRKVFVSVFYLIE
jgi:hypothetical protein